MPDDTAPSGPYRDSSGQGLCSYPRPSVARDEGGGKQTGRVTSQPEKQLLDRQIRWAGQYDRYGRGVEVAAVRSAPAPQTHLAPAAETPSQPPRGDHDGETVHLEDFLAARGSSHRPAGEPGLPVAGPPTVSLLPHRATQPAAQLGVLAVCVPAHRPPLVGSRLALGRVPLADGTLVELDREVVLGRLPSAARAAAADLPRLLAVGGRDVSRNHLEMRLEDWNVLDVELGWQNGTVLRGPGQPPVRLSARDPVPLRSGDELDLGGGVVLVAEDLP